MRAPRIALAVALLSGCSTTPIQTPTRSLDRPTSAALVCAQFKDNKLNVLPLSECQNPSLAAVDYKFLYMLVSNANRGEVAAAYTGYSVNVDFGTPDAGTTASVLDVNHNAPGYGFVPVGALPEPIRTSPDGSWGVTADRGSCDFAMLNPSEVLKAGVGTGTLPPDAVKRIAMRAGGHLVNARPSWVELSPVQPTTSSCRDPSTPERRVIATLPTCQLVVEVKLCGDDADATVDNITQAYRVTRDGATPIADLNSISCPSECFDTAAAAGQAQDLSSSDDLSASTDDLGAGTGDAGASDGGTSTTSTLPPILPNTSYPFSLGIATPGDAKLNGNPGALAIVVGDAVSPRVTIIGVDGSGNFGSARYVTLDADAQGVERVSVSPPIPALGSSAAGTFGPRFAYLVARDRTVRVVDVDQGFECETNPTQAAVEQATAGLGSEVADFQNPDPGNWQFERALRCLQVGKTPRNPLSTSPGIFLPGAALPRDVVFTSPQKRPSNPCTPTSDNDCSTVYADAAKPAVMVGYFAWIVDSSGRIEAVNIADQCPAPNAPQAIINGALVDRYNGCNPVRFGYSCVVPTTTTTTNTTPTCNWVLPGTDGAPELSPFDIMPHRVRSANARWNSGETGTTSNLNGPVTLSVLPITYAGSVAVELSDATTYAVYSSMCSVGTITTDPATNVTTVATHGAECMPWSLLPTSSSLPWNFVSAPNPDVVPNEQWSVVWEGLVPGSSRAMGSVSGASLNDTGAVLCSRGVEARDTNRHRPGDKLYLDGCLDDTNCGGDQYCYHDLSGTAGSTGLCLTRPNADVTQFDETKEYLNHACDPWTQGVLHYRITQVRQDLAGSHLTYEELPLPENEQDQHGCTTDSDCKDIRVVTYKGSNEPISLKTKCLRVSADPNRTDMACLVPCSTATPTNDAGTNPDLGAAHCVAQNGDCSEAQCGAGFICAPSALGDERCMRAPLPPPTGDSCFTDGDCYAIARSHGVACSGATQGTATSAPTPGKCVSLCFGELQSYEVHGGDVFIVSGTSSGYLHSDYPDAKNNGVCTAQSDTDVHRTLEGRLVLDPPGCPESVNGDWLSPWDPSTTPAMPNTCRIAAQDTQWRHLRFQNSVIGFVVNVPNRTVSFSEDVTGAEGCLPLPDLGTTDLAAYQPLDMSVLPGAPLDMQQSDLGCAPLVPSKDGVIETFRTYVPVAGTTLRFNVVAGFRPLTVSLSSDIVSQMPRSAIVAPDGITVYVVDEGLQSSTTGLRGQVIRFYTDTQSSDSTFRIR